MNKLWLFLLCLLFVTLAPAQGLTLRAATANWYPFAYYDEQEQLKGISVEIMQHLARQTGNQVEIRLYPAKRLAQLFRQGKLDINIADSPLWNPRDPRSPPLFSISYLTVNEFLYFPADQKQQVTNVSDLKNMRIGTELGYYYPMLEPAFRTGAIERIEYQQATDMLTPLLRHHLDAMAMDEWLFSYLLKMKQLDPHRFQRGLQLSSTPLGLKLHPSLQALKPELDSALKTMLEDGTIATIIDRYTKAQMEHK